MAGYESQIHNGFLEGDRTRPVDCGTGGIFRRQNARRVVADDFAWFRKTIIADGPHMAVWVNGFQVTDWTDKRPPDPNPRRGLRLRSRHDHDPGARPDDRFVVSPDRDRRNTPPVATAMTRFAAGYGGFRRAAPAVCETRHKTCLGNGLRHKSI